MRRRCSWRAAEGSAGGRGAVPDQRGPGGGGDVGRPGIEAELAAAQIGQIGRAAAVVIGLLPVLGREVRRRLAGQEAVALPGRVFRVLGAERPGVDEYDVGIIRAAMFVAYRV